MMKREKNDVDLSTTQLVRCTQFLVDLGTHQIPTSRLFFSTLYF